MRIRVTRGNREMLRIMAANSGHLEVGGRVIRKYDPRGLQYESEVIGRTCWVGQPPWAHGCGMDKAQIIATVEKAIAGKKLGKRQNLLIETMLEDIAETQANSAA